MPKPIFLFLFALMVFQTVKAQKRDSLMLNMSIDNRMLDSKDSADHFLQIMFPADSSTGVKINDVKEFYTNNRLKFTGKAIILVDGKQLTLNIIGPHAIYYPNGLLYSITENELRYRLIDCRDSTGNILAHNGNGKWIKFSNDFKHKIEEGAVKDSVEEGEWLETVGDSVKYITKYKHGEVVSSTNPNSNQIFADVEQMPNFKGGPVAFNSFLARTVRFPATDRQNGTQGKVIVTFIVEKNGTLSNVKALRGPTPTLKEAAVQAVQQSPRWVPGVQNGKPVRTQFTISFGFSITEETPMPAYESLRQHFK